MAAVATLDRVNANHTPPATSLQERIATLMKTEIDFIPNASFEVANFSSDSPMPDAFSGSDNTNRLPSELPAHLARLCSTGLLSPAEEPILFRQMNFYKFLASELRASIDVVEPDPTTLDSIEFMLGQARMIRDHIIQANLRLVMSIVKKFVTPSQSFDELLSEGTVTLMQAVEKFDFDRGFRFSTYAYRSISRTAYQFVASAREEEALMVRDADEWAFGQCDDQQTSSMSERLLNGLRDLTATMLHHLDRRERFIIRSRYALGPHRRVRTFQDLANKLGVSKERVRQIEARAVGKLQAMAKECDLDSLRFLAS